MRGIVKLYSLVKGSGIIIGEDKREYIVKLDSIVGTGLRRLHENDVVEFKQEGTKAKDVNVLKGEQLDER